MNYNDSADAASARRHSSVIAHLEGSINAATVTAMHHAWSRLEEIAPSTQIHARAVRERMFWSSVESADGTTVVPLHVVPVAALDASPSAEVPVASIAADAA